MPEVSTRLTGPASEDASPTLLFHKFHEYDRFQQETRTEDRTGRTHLLAPFERKMAGRKLLEKVAEASHRVHLNRYEAWHERFRAACEELGAVTVPAVTWWRLVVGWAINPALEVGVELDRFLGFPTIPGSAVKGLLHHVAEMELTSEIPEPATDEPLPPEPPAALREATARALRVWRLFGSLAARRPADDGGAAPEPPIERLEAWRNRLAGMDLNEAWALLHKDLDRLTTDHTGGLVTCYDAVPDPRTTFRRDPLLELDVLTPHRPQNPGGKEGPNPTVFLAVAAGVDFELRFRLAPLPSEPDEAGTPAEPGRQELESQLKTWLLRGLQEHGLGAKTSAGYGYFHTGRVPALPSAPERPAPPPEPEIPPAQRYAELLLPESMHHGSVADALDKAIGEASPEELKAVAERFAAQHPETLAKWRGRHKKQSIRRRLDQLGLLDDGGDDAT